MKTEQKVLNNIKQVLKNKDINKLNKTGYNHLYLLSGFIAHYDINGFKYHYQDLRNLFIDILRSDAEQDLKELIKGYETEIKTIFENQEKEEDLSTIKFLMQKNNLKEINLNTINSI